MRNEQKIELIDGLKTAVTDVYDTKDSVFANTINNICHEDLHVENYDIEKVLPRAKYLFHLKMYGKDVYLPIRVKILYIINQAKNELQSYEKEKKFINANGEKLKTNLTRAIEYMKKVEKLYEINPFDEEDELLNVLRINDGNKKEREIAIESYKKILEYTNKTLIHKDTRKDAKETLIKKECVNNISSILKKRGIKKHRVEAIALIRDNGLEISNRF